MRTRMNPSTEQFIAKIISTLLFVLILLILYLLYFETHFLLQR